MFLEKMQRSKKGITMDINQIIINQLAVKICNLEVQNATLVAENQLKNKEYEQLLQQYNESIGNLNEEN